MMRYRSRAYNRDRAFSSRYDKGERYSQEERPPKRHDSHGHARVSYAAKEGINQESRKEEADSFWDTKWEAIELQKKADAQEKKGKHFLEEELKRKRAKEKGDSTPSLSPERRTPSPECDELKKINKMKEIQVKHRYGSNKNKHHIYTLN